MSVRGITAADRDGGARFGGDRRRTNRRPSNCKRAWQEDPMSLTAVVLIVILLVVVLGGGGYYWRR